jgi:large subunit ribosomal protein L15
MKFKKKKVHKMRASTFHGYGRGASHHKGSGNRGGKGRAGSGKKSDGKKPSFWKEPQGKHGFHSKSRMKLRPINIIQVEKNLADWETKGIATKQGNKYTVDLTKTGFNKLLATGNPKVAMHIRTDYASKNASSRLSEIGGSIEILKTIVKKEKKKAAPSKKKEAPASSPDESD